MYVYVQFAGRRGNQFFQYWVGRYIADALGWSLKIFSADERHIYLNPSDYPNIRWDAIEYIPNMKTVEEETGPYLLDIEAIIQIHRHTQQPVHIAKYLENIELVTKYQDYIRHLYKRDVPQKDRIVIHMRFGDLAHKNVLLNSEYIAYACKVVERHKKDVLIISEEPHHPCAIQMHNAIQGMGAVSVTIKPKAPIQHDIDDIASSTVIVMTNSTFSWWPAYLSPHAQEVNVFLHEKQFCSDCRGDYLFVKAFMPNHWNVS